jgi:hypothetical protein
VTRLLHPTDPIDDINFDCIAQSEATVDAQGRRRYLIGGGGYFARAITGWVFSVYGTVVTVSVPSTIAALEAREARELGVAA